MKADPKEAVPRFDATIAVDREERCGQLESLSSGETSVFECLDRRDLSRGPSLDVQRARYLIAHKDQLPPAVPAVN